MPLAVLEFGAPSMLGWLAAGALPWLVSLWNRRRREILPWAAVDLLLTAVRRSSRRLRREQLLLLALRTCLLLSVALAAAQPIWRTRGAPLAGAGRTHYVLVVDRSASMSVVTDGLSRLQRAGIEARRLTDGAPAGDCFSVIAWGMTAENLFGRPTFEASEALAAIDAMDADHTLARIDAAIAAANLAIERASKRLPSVTRHEIVFLSDMTAATWQHETDSDPLAAIAERWGGSDDDRGTPVAVQWMSCDDLRRQNVAVTRVAAEPIVQVLDQPFSVAAEVHNFGAEARSTSVELVVDGAAIAEQQVELEPDQTVVVDFETQLIAPGGHWLRIRLPEDLDAFPVDNVRHLVVDVRSEIRAICFFGAPNAAEDVARALNPAPSSSGVVVETAPIARLEETDLSRYDSVWLCNVGEPSPREARLLQRYVAGGGSLIVTLGSRVQAKGYNDRLGELLPAVISQQPKAGQWRLDPLGYQHPVAAPFEGQERSGLLNVQVNRYFPVRVRDGAEAGQIALAMDSGDPAVVLGPFGAGAVAVITTDPALQSEADLPWSTLAVSPSFLPLVREIDAHLSARARTDRRNVVAGQPLRMTFRQGELRIRPPRGQAILLPRSETDESTMFAETVRSGLYEVLSSNADDEFFAVNVDPRESNLAPAILPDQPQQQAASPIVGSNVRRLSRPFVWLAMLLALVELSVAWSLGRGWR